MSFILVILRATRRRVKPGAFAFDSARLRRYDLARTPQAGHRKGLDMRCGARWPFVAAVLTLLAPVSCVHREIRILSNPPGARVEMDGQWLMTERHVVDREGEVIEIVRPVERLTPISLPFYWYGTHKFVVEKEGYLREERIVHMGPPWYQWFPIDFFADNLLPVRINDVRTVAVDLQKERSIKDATPEEKEAMKNSLLERAGKFRQVAREKVPPPPVEAPAGQETPKPAPKADPTPRS